MTKKSSLLVAALGWGSLLWLIGYLLGILLFFVVPLDLIGWVITPIGLAIAVWVLFKKINLSTLNEYVLVGIAWMLIAMVFDYVFLVKLFNTVNYYKIDVYLYYVTMLVLPIVVGKMKRVKR